MKHLVNYKYMTILRVPLTKCLYATNETLWHELDTPVLDKGSKQDKVP